MQVFCFAVAPCSRVGIVQLRASPMKTSYLALSLLVAFTFAEGPRAQPSPRSITYVMEGSTANGGTRQARRFALPADWLAKLTN